MDTPVQLLPFDGEVLLYDPFLDHSSAAELFHSLENNIAWRQDAIRMYGKEIPLPRLTASFGEMYAYSGIRHPAAPIPLELQQLMNSIQTTTGEVFNSVLLNYYRNGNDSMGWHSDAEKELGLNPVVASVSLGVARKFQFRHRLSKELLNVVLGNGSLLLMRGSTQHHWQHQLPRQKSELNKRINITFRNVLSTNSG